MKKYAVGVDVGATHTKIAIINLHGRIVAKDSFLTRKYKRDALIKAVSCSLDNLLAQRRLKRRNILGLGMGVPGLVDFKKGLVFYFVNIPGWENIPLKKELERKIGLPSFIDNDVKVMALGELTYGAGRGYKNVICLTLGTGVGGAIVINGQLYRGASLVAGEIGHIPINEKGPLCNCGNSGCLEAYVGKEYFLREVRKALRKGSRSLVTKMVSNRLSEITPELLEQAAVEGDIFAKRKWEEMGIHIGHALVGIVNFWNPELIIIGGGMAEAGRFILGPAGRILKNKTMKVQRKAVKVKKARLGNEAGVIGAAELAKRNLL